MEVEISIPNRHKQLYTAIDVEFSTDAQYAAIPNSSSGYVCAVNVYTIHIECSYSHLPVSMGQNCINNIAVACKHAVIVTLFTKRAVLFF